MVNTARLVSSLSRVQGFELANAADVSLTPFFSEVHIVRRKYQPLQRFPALHLPKTAKAVGEIRRAL